MEDGENSFKITFTMLTLFKTVFNIKTGWSKDLSFISPTATLWEGSF